jgi:hypothetical protein
MWRNDWKDHTISLPIADCQFLLALEGARDRQLAIGNVTGH